jgi:hypothetical protein
LRNAVHFWTLIIDNFTNRFLFLVLRSNRVFGHKQRQPTKGFASWRLDGIIIGSKSLSTAVPADEYLLGFCFKFEHLFFNYKKVPGLTLINTATNAKPQTLAAISFIMFKPLILYGGVTFFFLVGYYFIRLSLTPKDLKSIMWVNTHNPPKRYTNRLIFFLGLLWIFCGVILLFRVRL